MKIYSDFNEMYSSNMKYTSCPVYNMYSQSDAFELQRNVENCICGAVDEWYDGLSEKSKENFAKFGLDWYDETGQGDKLCNTKSFQGVDNLFIQYGAYDFMRMMDRDVTEILVSYLDEKWTNARNDYMNKFNFYTDYEGED